MAEGGEAYDYVEGIIAGSDSGCDFPCQPCSVEGPIVESSGFCVTCDEYLCDDCYRHHKKSKLSRHHVLLDKDAMPKDISERRVVDMCTEPCKLHTGKVIEYYCPTHDAFGCSVCMTMDHKHCDDDYQYIPDVAKDLNLDDNDDFKDLSQSAERFRTKANISKMKIETSRNLTSKRLENFQNIKMKVYERFVSAERKLAKELSAIAADDASKLSFILNTYEGALEKTEALVADSKLLYKQKQMCSLFMLLKQAKQDQTAIASDLEKKENEVACMQYEVVIDKHVRSILKNTDPVGKLKIMSDDVTVEKIQEYTIRLADDSSQCWITGLTLLSENQLAAVDRANMKVKVVDLSQNKVTCVFNLGKYGAPREVVKMSDNQIAITCESEKIVVLDIDEASLIKYIRTIEVSGQCRGITRADDKLIVSFIESGRLEFITLDGDTVKTVEKDNNGKMLFHCPFYVFYDSTRDTLNVTTTGDNGTPNSVTSLSLNGTVNSVYTYRREDKSDGVTGVVADSYGSLYICCWRSHEVHMLSRTLEEDKVLLKREDGVYQPYAICLNEDLREFYVGMRSRDTIVAYSLPL